MYAIVDISGQQFKVEKDQKIYVHRIDGQVGSKVEFDQVLLIDNDKKVLVGTPSISGAMVSAKILEHLKGDKVIVFKKKRRKGYKVKNGHRQMFTQLQIESIVETGAKKTVAAGKNTTAKAASEKPKTKASPKKAAPKAAEKKTTTKAAPKKTAKKKAGRKKK